MADNKQKPNFADALKAQAKPVADPKETVEVETSPGVFKKVVRGSMSDAAWERTKQRAIMRVQPTSVEYDTPASEADRAAESKDKEAMLARDRKRQSLVELVKNEHYQPGQDGLVPDKKTLDELRSMSPKSAADYLELRVKQMEWKQEEESNRSKKLSESNSPEPTKDLGVTKPDQGSPDEWKQKPQGGMRSPGTQQEFDGAMGMSIDPRNPASAIPQMAMGAVDPNGKSPTGDPAADTHFARADAAGNATGEADAQALRDLSDNVGQTTRDMALTVPRIGAKVVDSVVGGSPLLSPEVKQDLGGAPNFIQNALASGKQQLGSHVAAAGDLFGMPGVAQRGLDMMNNANFAPDPTQAPAPAPADPAALQSQQPAPMPPPVSAGMSGSASVSGRSVGNTTPAPAAPDKYAEETRANMATREKLIDEQQRLDRKQIGSEIQLRSEAQLHAADMQKSEVDRQNALEDVQTKYTQGLEALKQQTIELSKQEIDPNRFWNNKSDGQKAAAVIAGALFGFTGQGMQWLQRLDGLVAQDMQAQAQDLQRKRGLLSDATGLQNNLIAQAEAKGLRGAAAYKAATIAQKENLASNIEMNAMKYSDPLIQNKAMQAALAIRQSTEKDLAEYSRTIESHKADINLKYAQADHARASAFAARVAAGGGSKGSKIPAQIEQSINLFQRGVESIKIARTAIGSGTWGQALKDEVAKHIPGTEAAGRAQAASVALESALKGIRQEALSDSERKDYVKFAAGVGIASMNQGDLNALERMLKKSHDFTVMNARRQGQDAFNIPLYFSDDPSADAGRKPLITTERPIEDTVE